MDDKLCFVQFLHRGGEHEPDRGSIKNWNRNNHERKFLKSAGAYLAGPKPQKGEIVFWGEWEPESRVQGEIDDPIDQRPRFIYEPYYVVPKSYDGLQNTDPFVFGEQFHYTVCLQRQFPQLRHLSEGSVILFGSCKHHAFVLDTVFVVGDHPPIDHTRANYRKVLAGAISQEYEKVTISPIYQKPVAESRACCRAGSQQTLRLYSGATYAKPMQGMYSFFPCQPYEVKPRGFARPRIRLPEIADKKNRGIKLTYLGSLDEMKSLWGRVVEQVIRDKQHLVLGVHAKMPERCIANK
jgi:hypothetical protein